jgi:hypothetical protein
MRFKKTTPSKEKTIHSAYCRSNTIRIEIQSSSGLVKYTEMGNVENEIFLCYLF